MLGIKTPLQTPDMYESVLLERSDYTTLSSNESQSALRFGRFEFKYVVSERERATLEASLEAYMSLDSYCETAERSYQVNSVYFDDRKLSCYHQTIEGALNRRKFRLRQYRNRSLIYLEEKGRRNAFSYKNRRSIPEAMCKLALQSDWRDLVTEGADEAGDPLPNFIAAGLRGGLSPKLRVSYRRRAYVGIGGYRFRVTFDDQIKAEAATDLSKCGSFRRDALPGRCVVEIKFEYQVPLRFIRQIEIQQLRRLSISKYCICAEALGIVTQIER